MSEPVVKRAEFTAAELSILLEAMKLYRRKFAGRAGYAKSSAENLERQAQYVERREKESGLEPMLGPVYRQGIPDHLAKEAANREKANLTKGLLDRLQAPADPLECMIADEAMAQVKAGRCAMLLDLGEEAPWGVIVPPGWAVLCKKVMGALGSWRGAWTIVKLPPDPEEAASVD